MPRNIVDGVVRLAYQELGMSTRYLDEIPRYFGEVNCKMNLVRISKSEYGMVYEPVIKWLKDKYDSIVIMEEECVIHLGEDITKTVSKEQLKLLKALAIEQMNRDNDYSSVVAYAFTGILKQFICGKVTLNLDEPKGCSKMQAVVLEEILKFSKQVLKNNVDIIIENQVIIQ